MPREQVGEAAVLYTAEHPPRTDSPEYVHTRRWLQKTHGHCIICGDPKIQDHHGGGIYIADTLIGVNLIALEWSLGFSADPVKVAAGVANLNDVLTKTGDITYDDPILTTDDVMTWVDSPHNANVSLCQPHHTGRMDAPSKDHQGHEAVGIHEIPGPIWWAQATNDWARWDMWAGTTGTIAVAPDGHGGAIVLHAEAAHHAGLRRGAVLAPSHHITQTATQGATP